MDILIPLGRASTWQNNELRYCLRSIEKFASGYDRIFVVGDDPGFLSKRVEFRATKDIPANKQAAIAHKIFWAFQYTDISNTVALFNDDYVLRDRVNLGRLLSYQRGPLEAALASQDDPVYRASLEETMCALRDVGKPAYHYDIHVPIIITGRAFVELKAWWAKSICSKNGLVVKSTYANNALLYPGPVMRDCKLRERYDDIDQATRGRFVFSYSDAGLTEVLKRWLTETFPEKSKWENGV